MAVNDGTFSLNPKPKPKTSTQTTAANSGFGGNAGTDLLLNQMLTTQPSTPTTPDYAAPSDTTGDMTGYSTPMAAPRLATSPEWLAYLSALGLEESQARADVDRMRGIYQSEAERLKQDLVPQYGQQRRGITGSLEARGMSRSGELLRRLAENRAAEGRQRAGIEANLAGQVGQLESQLAQRIGSLASQRAQQEMALRAQGYV